MEPRSNNPWTMRLSVTAAAFVIGVGCTSMSHWISGNDPSHPAIVKVYEVSPCSSSICTNDLTVLPVNPLEQDLVALGLNGDAAAMTLDESNNVDDIKGSEAENALWQATVVTQFLNQLFLGGDNSHLAKYSLAIWMSDAYDLSKDRPLKIKSLAVTAQNSLKALPFDDIQKIRSAIRLLAGDDGWINLGDKPRLLPSIPNIIGHQSHQTNKRGFAEEIAEIAQTQQDFFRRWRATHQGIVGCLIPKDFADDLESTYGTSWTNLVTSSQTMQSSFGQIMRSFGVNSFYLNSTEAKTYVYDLGKPLDADQIGVIVQAFTGLSFKTYLSKIRNSEAVSLIAAPVFDKLGQKLRLPTGIPTGNDAIINESKDGKIEIARISP